MDRQTKRVLNQLHKRAGYGRFVIDCRYHPCLVIEVDRDVKYPYQDGCRVQSLITGTVFGCSYLNCGIEPITKALAEEMAAFAKDPNNSFDDYLIKYKQMTQEEVAWFNEQDKEWNFEKTEPRVQRILGDTSEEGGPSVQSIME